MTPEEINELEYWKKVKEQVETENPDRLKKFDPKFLRNATTDYASVIEVKMEILKIAKDKRDRAFVDHAEAEGAIDKRTMKHAETIAALKANGDVPVYKYHYTDAARAVCSAVSAAAIGAMYPSAPLGAAALGMLGVTQNQESAMKKALADIHGEGEERMNQAYNKAALASERIEQAYNHAISAEGMGSPQSAIDNNLTKAFFVSLFSLSRGESSRVPRDALRSPNASVEDWKKAIQDLQSVSDSLPEHKKPRYLDALSSLFSKLESGRVEGVAEGFRAISEESERAVELERELSQIRKDVLAQEMRIKKSGEERAELRDTVDAFMGVVSFLGAAVNLVSSVTSNPALYMDGHYEASGKKVTPDYGLRDTLEYIKRIKRESVEKLVGVSVAGGAAGSAENTSVKATMTPFGSSKRLKAFKSIM